MSLIAISGLSACDKFEPTDLSTDQVYAIHDVVFQGQSATIGYGIQKAYVLKGKFSVWINANQKYLKPGLCYDMYQGKVYTFNMQEFVAKYKAQFPQELVDVLI